MSKFHINENGDPGKCSAKKGNCPFGGPNDHFDSKEAARTAYEQKQTNTMTTIQKENSLKVKKFNELFPQYNDLPNVNGKPFNEAWDEKYNALNGPELKLKSVNELLDPPAYALRERGTWIESHEDILRNEDFDMEYVDDDSDYYIVLHTRQGGGNRECYCDDYDNHEDGCLALNNEMLENHPDHIQNVDDSFDSTYASFMFKTNLTSKDVKDFYESKNKATEQINLKKEYDSIVNGELPPWTAFATEPQLLTSYKNLKKYSETLPERITENEQKLKNIDHAFKVLNEDSLINDKDKEFIIKLTEKYPFHERITGKHIDNYNYAFKKLKEKENLIKETNDLPDDSPLKEYLIGDRGTFTYNVTEKVGRRNVKVQKTGVRKPLLEEELEAAQRGFRNSKTDIRGVKKLDSTREEIKSRNNEMNKQLNGMRELREAAWADGWPGLKKDLPAIPESF